MLTANILYRESKAMQERVKVAETVFDNVYLDYNRDDTELTISDYRKAKDTLNACKEAVKLLNKREDIYQFLYSNEK